MSLNKPSLNFTANTSVVALHCEYGVSEVTIYNWIKSLIPGESADGLTPAEIDEIKDEEVLPYTFNHSSSGSSLSTSSNFMQL